VVHVVPILSRRSALQAGAVAAGLLSPWSRSLGSRADGLAVVLPDPADALVDAFGVVTHLHFLDTVYADHDKVAFWLSLLGVRHVRNRLSIQPDVLDAFENLASSGIRVQGVCGALGDPQPMDLLVNTVVRRYADPTQVLSAFEGLNEPNNDGVPWVAETRAQTIALRQARDTYGLSAIPIVAPALARVDIGGVEGATTFEQAANLGDLSAYVDYGNIHVYPRGLQPSEDIDYFTGCATQVSGTKPIMCTEGGYFTATDYVGPASPVPQSVAAAYTPQMLLEHWLAGSPRFFRYELFDDPGADEERESSFGMVQAVDLGAVDLSLPKPDFYAIRRLLAVFSDPGPDFEPAPLSMSLTGPADLRSVSFAKRDGTHLLCLWLDRPIYDPETRRLTQDPAERTATAELSLDTARDVTVESLVDPDRHEKDRATTSVSVALPAGVTIVALEVPT
jgi:hypothetical protein